MAEKSDFFKYAANPRSYTIRKWVMELIKGKYSKRHDSVIERITVSLQTDEDVEEFGHLLATVYETGYMKAIEEYKAKVEELGVKVKIGQ